jgi:hypothetical protein
VAIESCRALVNELSSVVCVILLPLQEQLWTEVDVMISAGDGGTIKMVVWTLLDGSF